MKSVECKDILVVDDSDSIRRYLKLTLERVGFSVRVCSDATEACWEIQSNVPDFVISDWQMPNMDGGELCKWVRARDSETTDYIYFILITAHERFFNVVDGLNAGADDYLQKPIKANELMARIRCGQRILRLERQLRSTIESKDAVL